MDSLRSPFLSPFPSPSPNQPHRRLPSPAPLRSALSSDPWSLSSGNGGSGGGGERPRTNPYRRNPRKPLSDDDARRIIRAKAAYLSRLRRNQGSGAETPRWIRRTPEQMVRYIEGDRDGHLYGRHVVAAIRAVRGLSSRPEGSYNMREVMASFVAKLSFREMCIVLKEQRGWRQVRDFFEWMKLQVSRGIKKTETKMEPLVCSLHELSVVLNW